jgi:hypothetical protein
LYFFNSVFGCLFFSIWLIVFCFILVIGCYSCHFCFFYFFFFFSIAIFDLVE